MQTDLLKALTDRKSLISAQMTAQIKNWVTTTGLGDVERLTEELLDLQMEALQSHLEDPEDDSAFVELVNDKLATIKHVLDAERLVAEGATSSMILGALRTGASMFLEVGKVLIKATLKGAIGAVGGGALSSVVEDLVAGAIEKTVEKAIDKTTT